MLWEILILVLSRTSLGGLKSPGTFVYLIWCFQFRCLNNDCPDYASMNVFCKYFRLYWIYRSEAAAAQLCCSMKAAIGRTELNEHGHVPVRLYHYRNANLILFS